MATLGEFAKNITRRGEQIENNLNKKIRATALAVEQTVVAATPVKTGRAKINWNVALGNPDRTVHPAPETPESGVTNLLNSAATTIATRKPGQAIYITNNLDYIEDLNNGSSAQAPAGFVDEAVDVAVLEISKLKVFD